MKVRRSTLKDTVIVSTRTGESSYGDVFADPLVAPCLIDETRRLVRDTGGQETISECTLTLHPRTRFFDDPDTIVSNPMDVFTAESTVLIGGRTSRVLSAKELKLRGYVVAVEVTCA